MPTKLLIVVSDLHCGSDVGLMPPVVTTRSGNEVRWGDNLHQAWLWKTWQEGVKRVSAILKADSAALLINGDATEGVHHRNNPELVAQKTEEHCAMAEESLQPFLKLCSTRLVVAGTECHTQHIEDLLAKNIGAESGRAKDKWHFNINGCPIDAAHHMPTSSRAYLEAGAMSISMGNAIQNCVRAGHPISKVFLRGHRHCGGYYSDGHGLFAVTGGWQFLTRHGHKVVTDSIPRPSILVLDWRGKPEGSLPFVHDITFNPPKHETTSL